VTPAAAQLSLLEPTAAPPRVGALPLPWSKERYEEPFVTPPLARASDPETSHVAAQHALPAAREQGKHIASCLRGMGPLREDGTGGGTALEIAWALNEGADDGPWDVVIVSRRISGLRLNYVYSFDGKDGRMKFQRKHEGHGPMAVHVAKGYGGQFYPPLQRVA
jgi:hypothetical protein